MGASAVDVDTANADPNPESDADTERHPDRECFRQCDCLREFNRFVDSGCFADCERFAGCDSAGGGASIAETGSFSASEAEADSGCDAKFHTGQNAVARRHTNCDSNREFECDAGKRRSRGAGWNRRAERERNADQVRDADGGNSVGYAGQSSIDSGNTTIVADPNAIGDADCEPGHHADANFNSEFDADGDRSPAGGSETEPGAVRSTCGKPDPGRFDAVRGGRAPEFESAAERVSIPVRFLDNDRRAVRFRSNFRTSTETSPRRSIKSIDAPDAERLTISHTAPSPTLRLSILSQSSHSGITGASSTIFRSKPRI
jgi:hypothetical protein